MRKNQLNDEKIGFWTTYIIGALVEDLNLPTMYLLGVEDS